VTPELLFDGDSSWKDSSRVLETPSDKSSIYDPYFCGSEAEQRVTIMAHLGPNIYHLNKADLWTISGSA